MAKPKSLSPVSCQNSKCKYYLNAKEKDIIKRGKNHADHQLYKCLHCNHTFSETKLTPLHRKHLSEEEIMRISKLLVERNGIRSIERITSHHQPSKTSLCLNFSASKIPKNFSSAPCDIKYFLLLDYYV